MYSEYYGEYSDYTRKGGVICSDILLPSHAPPEYADRQTLWNAVEKAERGKNAQLAYSFDIALQNEFSLEENIALARQFLLENFVSRGMVVDFAVHQPDREDGGIPNPHFHVLCPMFAGIGGFRTGLTRAGGFRCVGHCEIDKYANASYEAIYEPGKEERYYHDATKIDPADLPDFDLLCGGFPCQAFSIAGRRKGFDDTRGTLFFEIARLAQSKRPSYLLLENVPGLLSHDKGRTFSVILATLNDLGYRVEWMVLNSKHFGVPQSRRRLFLICYLDPRCAGKIFPVFGTGGKALIQVLGGSQGSRVYDADGIACTQTAGAGGVGGKTGLYIIPQDRPFVDLCAGEARQTKTARCLTARYGQTTLSNHRAERSGVLLIKEATKKGYKEANPGDSVDLGFSGSNTRRGRVGQDIAHTLETSCIQGIVERGGRIRRLMPRECLRLQGFDEWQIDRILAIQSDAQAYKQAGNSVTANVIEAIGRRIREVDAELKAGAAA